MNFFLVNILIPNNQTIPQVDNLVFSKSLKTDNNISNSIYVILSYVYDTLVYTITSLARYSMYIVCIF